jgi:hypothetical protein
MKYPAWICRACGEKYGRIAIPFMTYHVGDPCGWCGTMTAPVTEPRDFGHPPVVRTKRKHHTQRRAR